MTATQPMDEERKLRPTWTLVGIGLLESLDYSFTKYPSGTTATILPWVALSIYLFWRIWRGSEGAWLALMVLNIGSAALVVLAVFNVVHTGQSGVWLFCRALIVGASLLLLASSRMRRWVTPHRPTPPARHPRRTAIPHGPQHNNHPAKPDKTAP